MNEETIYTKVKKTAKKTRRPGQLSSPPGAGDAGPNLSFAEGAGAVPVAPKRKYRISTYITDEAGRLLEDLQYQARKAEERKVSLAEIIERGLASLNREIENK